MSEDYFNGVVSEMMIVTAGKLEEFRSGEYALIKLEDRQYIIKLEGSGISLECSDI